MGEPNLQLSRRTVLIGSAALTGALAVACGGTPTAQEAAAPRALTKENITLSWATPGNQQEIDVYKKVAENFTKTYPNIKVESDPAASGRDKMTTLMASNSLPDIIFRTINDWPMFAVQNIWMPLDDSIKRDKFDLQDFFPQIIKPYRYDGKRFGEGKLYGLPKEIAIRAMYYNVD
ncbi:MAG TPA: extracellular solute-binding protein, partial [Chloroflexota bacterium]|nr:extracellular solute-binding protein [Chloroflexota bacterium]